MILTYKYKLKPKRVHIDKIEHTFDCIHKLKQIYLEDFSKNKNLPSRAIDIISYYKNIRPELIDGLDYSAILNAMIEIQNGNKKFVANHTKAYKTRVSDNLRINYPIKDNSVYLPKIGRVKYINSRDIPKDSKTLYYIISKDNIGNYFFSIEFETNDSYEKLCNFKNVLGLDYSAKHLAVDNNGNTYDLNIPNETQRYKKISEYQRKLTKYKKDSLNYKRTVRMINKEYNYMYNYRRDFLHKLSTKMAEEYDAISIEDLSMKQLASERNMGRSTNHNAYYSFVTCLDYKLKSRGKKLIKVGRYFPSSKLCSNCGFLYSNLKINERVWTCPSCKATNDRDINAAINIKNEGLRLLGNT